MRVLIGALVLLACACGSARRLEDWRSDQALFTAAVRVSPALPSAALNLGAAYLRTGDWELAAQWTSQSAHLSSFRPAPPTAPGLLSFKERLRWQLVWIDTFRPVCDQRGLASWCVS